MVTGRTSTDNGLSDKSCLNLVLRIFNMLTVIYISGNKTSVWSLARKDKAAVLAAETILFFYFLRVEPVFPVIKIVIK